MRTRRTSIASSSTAIPRITPISFGGSLRIDAAPGGGTRVQATVSAGTPVQTAAADSRK
jgi:hypothetical protein